MNELRTLLIGVVVTGMSLAVHAAPAPGPNSAPIGDPPAESVLRIGPVAGLTEGWHVAPTQTAIPLGTVVVFAIDVPGPDDLLVEGDFFDHEYTFTRHGRTVAVVSKKWFTFADTYGVDVMDGENDLLMLCCTIAIAEACKRKRRR